jgi:hypothetical protein
MLAGLSDLGGAHWATAIFAALTPSRRAGGLSALRLDGQEPLELRPRDHVPSSDPHRADPAVPQQLADGLRVKGRRLGEPRDREASRLTVCVSIALLLSRISTISSWMT